MDVLWPHYGLGMCQTAALLLVPDHIFIYLQTKTTIMNMIGYVSVILHFYLGKLLFKKVEQATDS